MARPKKQRQDARTVRFNLRFSPDEWSEVEPKAAIAGLMPAEFCRLAVLGQPMQAGASSITTSGAPPSAAPVAVAQVVALNRVGVNLNQIARALNSGVGFVPAELEDALSRVNRLLDDWQGISP